MACSTQTQCITQTRKDNLITTSFAPSKSQKEDLQMTLRCSGQVRTNFLDVLYAESDRPYSLPFQSSQNMYTTVCRSLFFAKLPREVRDQIYILVITTARDIPLYLRPRKPGQDKSYTSKQAHCNTQSTSTHCINVRSPANFLATCKAINKEATALLYRHIPLTLTLQEHYPSSRLGASSFLDPCIIQSSTYALERIENLVLTIALVDSKVDHKVEKRMEPLLEMLSAIKRGRVGKVCRLRLQCHGACDARDAWGNSVGASMLGSLCDQEGALKGISRVEVGVERTERCRRGGPRKGQREPHLRMVEEVEKRVRGQLGQGRFVEDIVPGEACGRVVFVF